MDNPLIFCIHSRIMKQRKQHDYEEAEVMRRKKRLAWMATALIAVMLAGCGGDGTAVYVQPVSELSAMGGIAPGDRFAGIVVSENVAEIQKDAEKTIAQLMVSEGDDVKQGDPLFSYDMDELQLALDKQLLEQEQLKVSIENYKAQIQELERDRDRVGAANKLQYTIQIQSAQVDLKESELKLKAKDAEIIRSREIMENSTVVSPVTGRVQSVSEGGTDNYGNPLPYISIQQAGAYRVKGTLGELQRGGITEGSVLKITSRTNPDQIWQGTVTLVDYENPTQGNQNNYYIGGNVDEMTNSSHYPFYVELEHTDGLILGQHVYIELAVEEDIPTGIPISMAYICFEEDDTAYVWAENRGKLEKRTVVLGNINDMMGTIEILEGLTEADYIAFPDPELCQEGVSTTRSQQEEVPAEEGGVA